jgi:fluoroquinolone resistance protein
MERLYTEDGVFEKKDYSVHRLPEGDYENCQFMHCNFSNADLSGCNFIECSFTTCNLGRAKLSKVSFRDVIFKDSKMIGLHFEDCNEFMLTMEFDHCILDYSSFERLKLQRIKFMDCHMHELVFSGTDLTGAEFSHSDLQGTRFEQCVLEKADFSSALQYSIDPENNRIKKARFSLTGLTGLLDKYDIIVE